MSRFLFPLGSFRFSFSTPAGLPFLVTSKLHVETQVFLVFYRRPKPTPYVSCVASRFAMKRPLWRRIFKLSSPPNLRRTTSVPHNRTIVRHPKQQLLAGDFRSDQSECVPFGSIMILELNLKEIVRPRYPEHQAKARVQPPKSPAGAPSGRM